MKCLGKQTTIEDIRSQKTLLYEKFHSNKQSPDYEKHFLRYIPRYKFIPHSSSLRTRKNKSTNKNRTMKNNRIIPNVNFWDVYNLNGTYKTGKAVLSFKYTYQAVEFMEALRRKTLTQSDFIKDKDCIKVQIYGVTNELKNWINLRLNWMDGQINNF